MEFTIKLDTVKSGWPIAYGWVTGNNFLKYCYYFLKIDFGIANNADPNEMPHLAAFHLRLQCLPKYPFSVSGTQWVKRLEITAFVPSVFSSYLAQTIAS